MLAEAEGALVGIDTTLPNRLVAEALAAEAIPELQGYVTHRPEVRYGAENSRIDFLLSGPDRPDCYLEVKNVHLMRQPGLAASPDSVTPRGAQNLPDIAAMVAAAQRAAMLYLVHRPACGPSRWATACDPD